MEESETLISEREIPRMLAEYQVFSLNCILNGQLQQGFEILQRSSELIQAAVCQEAVVSSELIILTEHTLAFYYHSVGDSVNEANSLRKTMHLFKNYLKSLPNSFLSKPSNRIFKARILLNLHFQLLAAYSKLEMFEEAFVNARSALRRCQSIVHNTLRACQDHLQRHKAMSASSVIPNQSKNPQYILLESPHYQLFHNLVLKAIPILLFLDEKTSFVPKVTLPLENDVKFEDLTKIQPWNFETLVKVPEMMEELERDLMIEKILFQVAGHFFLGNLLKRSRNEESRIEAKIMMKRAWSITKTFLPVDSSIFLTVFKTREKKTVVNRIRSISRIRTSGKSVKCEQRSASSNKFRTSPSKKFTETYKEINVNKEEQTSGNLVRRKIVGKFKKIKLK